MLNCPVCRQVLHKPLPPFCDQCGWDLENDLILVASLDPIPENVQKKYTQRLAIAIREWDKYDRMIAACSEGIAIMPDYAQAYIIRGHLYNSKGDYDRAIADYTRAIAMKPGATTYHNRGCAYRKIGREIAAKRDFEKYEELKRRSKS
jgi:tetratricopeptide (TPR) repeat protein